MSGAGHTPDSPQASGAVRTDVWCFVALLVLAAGSYGASFLGLGWARVPVALTFSLAKAAIVVSFFMELRHRPFSNRFVGAVALALFGTLLALVAADTLMREPAPLLAPDAPR